MNRSQIADRLAGGMGLTKSSDAVDAVFKTIGPEVFVEQRTVIRQGNKLPPMSVVHLYAA